MHYAAIARRGKDVRPSEGQLRRGPHPRVTSRPEPSAQGPITAARQADYRHPICASAVLEEGPGLQTKGKCNGCAVMGAMSAVAPIADAQDPQVLIGTDRRAAIGDSGMLAIREAPSAGLLDLQ